MSKLKFINKKLTLVKNKNTNKNILQKSQNILYCK